jgi:lysylphosphatidylglycerol synthetase-like protein (DUF2156 family)
MTPEQRRAKWPLDPVTPMAPGELRDLRRRTEEWLRAPGFTHGLLDRTYHTYARLIATIDSLDKEGKE